MIPIRRLSGFTCLARGLRCARRTSARVAVAAAALLSTSSQAAAATYYVDAATGNDSAIGTNPTAAWRTIAKVNVSTFAPGDQVLFRRGQVWREQLNIRSSGSALNPIVFADYGSGAKPVISGADVINSWMRSTPGVWRAAVQTAPGQLVARGTGQPRETSVAKLNTEGEWTFDPAGAVYFYSSEDPATIATEITVRRNAVSIVDVSFVQLRNLVVRDTNEDTIFVSATTRAVQGLVVEWIDSVRAGRAGIMLADTGGRPVDGISIRGTTVLRAGMVLPNSFGIAVGNHVTTGLRKNVTIDDVSITESGYPQLPGPGDTIQPASALNLTNCTDCRINALTAHHNANMGINIENGSSRVTISNSRVIDNGEGLTGDRHGIGIGGTGAGSSNITIQDTEISGNSNGPATSGIEIASTTIGATHTGVRVQRSRIYDNGGFGIHIGGRHLAQEISYAAVYRNSRSGVHINDGPSGSPEVAVYNTVIYQNGTGTIGSRDGLSISGNAAVVLKNNIVSNHTSGAELSKGTGSGRFESDYNVWHRAGATPFLRYRSVEYALPAWRATTRQDAHSSSTAPGLVNPAAGDFRLTPTSPCIDAGTPLGFVMDLLKASLVRQVDIGAYEYVLPLSPLAPRGLRIIGSLFGSASSVPGSLRAPPRLSALQR